jgi:hypothetical protein
MNAEADVWHAMAGQRALWNPIWGERETASAEGVFQGRAGKWNASAVWGAQKSFAEEVRVVNNKKR